jgi:hypothetical protein
MASLLTVRTWQLQQGATLLGRLTDCERDPAGGPCVYCRFQATPLFEDVRPLFDQLRRCLDRLSRPDADVEEVEAFGESVQAVAALNLRLHSLEGEYVWGGFLLTISGDDAKIEV